MQGGGEGASKSKTYILVLAKMFWLKMANKGNASLGLGFWMHLRLSGSSFGADLGSSFWMQLRLSGSSFGADLGSSFWMHLSLGVWSFGAKWQRKNASLWLAFWMHSESSFGASLGITFWLHLRSSVRSFVAACGFVVQNDELYVAGVRNKCLS